MSGSAAIRRGRLGLALVAIVAAVCAGRAVQRPYITPDLCRYAVTSQALTAGDGLRERINWTLLKPIPPDAAGTSPLTEQPPLYPLVLAALGATPERLWPAQAATVAAIVALALLTAWVCMTLAGPRLGVAAGCLVPALYPVYRAAHWIITEPPFMAALMGMLGCMMAARRARRPALLQWGAGWLAAAAVGARYSGFCVFPLLGWEAARQWRRRGAATGAAAAARLLAPSVILTALLLLRNQRLVGAWRGMTGQVPFLNWAETLRGMPPIVFGQFGWYGWKLPALAGVWIVVAAVAIGRDRAARRRAALAWGRGLDLLAVLAVVYLALLTVAIKQTIGVFEYRFATPLLPPAVVVIFAAAGWLAPRAGRRTNGVMLFRWAALGALALIGLPPAWTAVVGQYRNAGASLTSNPMAERLADNQTLRWLLEHRPPRAIVATNDAFGLAFFGGMPTLWIPDRSFEKTLVLPANAEEALLGRMREIGAPLLALFCGPEGLSAAGFGEGIARLSRRQEDPGVFRKIHEAPDGVIYELAPAPGE